MSEEQAKKSRGARRPEAEIQAGYELAAAKLKYRGHVKARARLLHAHDYVAEANQYAPHEEKALIQVNEAIRAAADRLFEEMPEVLREHLARGE